MYTAKQAFKDSLLKWSFFRKRDYDNVFHAHDQLRKKHSRLSRLFWSCGLCEKFKNRQTEFDGCDACPLFKVSGKESCWGSGSHYAKWYSDPTASNADTIYMLLKIAQEVYGDDE